MSSRSRLRISACCAIPSWTSKGRRPALTLPWRLFAATSTGFDFTTASAFVLAARFRPSDANSLALSKQRAQGMPGARCTRGLVCKNAHCRRTRAYRAAETLRHPLRNGFTAYFVLSPVSGLVVTVAGGTLPANLAPASRRQDHTTSPYALAFSSGAKKRLTPKRPPHPAPHVS